MKEKKLAKVLAKMEDELPEQVVQNINDDIAEAIAAFDACDKERSKVTAMHPVKELCHSCNKNDLKILAVELLLRKCNQVPIGGKMASFEKLANHSIGIAATFLNQFEKYTK